MVLSQPMSKTMIMEEVMMGGANWSDIGSEDDDLLVRELLDDDGSPPLLMLQPEELTTDINQPNNNNYTREGSSRDQLASFNRLITNIYSGPTITDIENALSVTTNNQRDHFQQFSSAR